MQEPRSAASTMPDGEVCEVADSSDSLITLIDNGEVPIPAMMSFNDWQKWRRDVGRRPTVRTNGVGTSSTDEVKIWRSSMIHVYGVDWETEFYAPVEDDEDREAEQEEASGSMPVGPAGDFYTQGQPRTPLEE